MADDPHLTRILDTARLRLPGATDFVLQTELMNVIQEFCVVTDAWQDDVNRSTLCPGQCEYTIFSPDGNGEIYRLMWVANADPQGPDFTAQSWLSTPETFKTTYDPSAAMKVKLRSFAAAERAGPQPELPRRAALVLERLHPGDAGRPDRRDDGAARQAVLERPVGVVLHAAVSSATVRSPARASSTAGRMAGQAWADPQSFAVCRRK